MASSFDRSGDIPFPGKIRCMQIYRFDRETASVIETDDSQNIAFTRIANEIVNAHIGMMYIRPGGPVGYHQAASQQLFMVVQGSGWVIVTDRRRIDIKTGQAVLWQDGEWHESGSNVGMNVVIIEADTIDLRLFTG